MKVLLLEHPRTITFDRANDIANTPLSSCLLSGYAAAALKKEGHDVEIVEGYLDGLSYEDIGKTIAGAKPDMLAIHMVYHWRRDLHLFDFLETVKREMGPYITAYGFYPTVAYGDILAHCGAIDSVIVGEPERTIVRLAGPRASGGSGPIPGLASRAPSGEITMKAPEANEDLDALPFPVRTEALLRLPEVNILGSRGCYGRCTFCYVNTFFQFGSPSTAAGRWRKRSPENIVEEMDAISSRTGSRRFYFADPNFFGPGAGGQERARRIADLVRERDVQFGLEGRVNDIHDETIGPLVEAGLRHILVGLESGRDESLRRMNKMTTVAQNERALGILRKHGVEPNVGFIMFEPDSSPVDLRTNFEFLRRNDLLKNLAVTANVLYHHQILLQGTASFQALEKEGRLVAAGDSSYEGTTCFRNREVAVLANIMRRVTNSLFSSMDRIWSGRVTEPPDAALGYEKLNRVLTGLFEQGLQSLESGKALTDEDADAVVEETVSSMDEILKSPLGLSGSALLPVEGGTGEER